MRSIKIKSKKTGEQQHNEPFRRRIRRRSDRLMNYFLAVYFSGGFIAAAFYNTWLIALMCGGISLMIYYLCKEGFKHSSFYQYVLSVVFGLFMVQYIYQMRGMYELYFFAFVGSTILITYQNWKLQIPLFIIVVVHLAIFGYHQDAALLKPYITQLSLYELERFILHILFTALIFFICGLWSYLLNKYSEVQVAQAKEMERLQQEALLAVKQQAVIESNTRLSYASQATSDAIWDRNYSENEIFWGDGYRALFGYDATEETSTISFWESKVHPEDLERVNKIIRNAKGNPAVNTWSCEYRFLKANGEYAYVKEKAIILRDENESVVRTIGALQDITELKQNELELKTLNESLEQEKYYLDSLMDNMPDAIYFKDRQSRFVRISRYMVNKHLSSHPGATIDDLLGKTDFDIQDPVHAKEAYDDEQEIMRTQKPKVDYIEKELTEDGSDRWVATTKLPLFNGHGEVVGTFGISRDVTKIKMLEKQEHEARLEKAVAENRFEIVSEVMHDIGNAVVGFGSYLTRIRRLQEQDTQEKLKNLVGYMENQKPAMAAAFGEEKADAIINMLSGIWQTHHKNQQEITNSITEQLNIVSNIENILNIQRRYISGHESKERKAASLKSIVEDSLSMLSSDKTFIDFSVNIADDLPPIKGDRTKLMQLMLNVIKNSIEATEENTGEKNISIHAFRDINKLVLQVKDNGKGFDSATASRLFNRGFTTKNKNTGQGLYHCKSILDSHEGTIDIASDGPGKGAVTTIGFKIQAA